MSYPREAMSLPDALALADKLNRAVGRAASEKTIDFKRSVLSVLACEGIDSGYLLAVAVEDHGTLYGVLQSECFANVAVTIRDWVVRFVNTGYDYVGAWAESNLTRGL